MVKYLDKTGEELTLDDLTEEVALLRDISQEIGYPLYTGPLDYEVQQYIQRCIEMGTIDIEVWD